MKQEGFDIQVAVNEQASGGKLGNSRSTFSMTEDSAGKGSDSKS